MSTVLSLAEETKADVGGVRDVVDSTHTVVSEIRDAVLDKGENQELKTEILYKGHAFLCDSALELSKGAICKNLNRFIVCTVCCVKFGTSISLQQGLLTRHLEGFQ